MSKHTPGPWDSHLTNGCWYIYSPHSPLRNEKEQPKRIAAVYSEANANLIAAAPDLLMALGDIYGDSPDMFLTKDGTVMCRHCGRTYFPEDGDTPANASECDVNCPGRIARAAIAKATGKEQ